jgi:2-haloacid dehalogenase
MVIVFDVNGTLLDTGALAARFQATFGELYSVREWFTEVVQYSMAVTLSGDFREFGDIAIHVLEMGATARGVQLSKSDVQEVLKAMQALPAFADVAGALRRLARARYRLAVLSNSETAALEKQLRNAKLDGFFERAESVSGVQKYKPAPEVYDFAARRLGVRTREVLMVAAHPWDLLGAAAAGCRTALITRPGKAPIPDLVAPDLVAADLEELADQILRTDRDLFRSKDAGAASWLLGGALAVGIAGAMLLGGGRRRPS